MLLAPTEWIIVCKFHNNIYNNDFSGYLVTSLIELRNLLTSSYGNLIKVKMQPFAITNKIKYMAFPKHLKICYFFIMGTSYNNEIVMNEMN